MNEGLKGVLLIAVTLGLRRTNMLSGMRGSTCGAVGPLVYPGTQGTPGYTRVHQPGYTSQGTPARVHQGTPGYIKLHFGTLVYLGSLGAPASLRSRCTLGYCCPGVRSQGTPGVRLSPTGVPSVVESLRLLSSATVCRDRSSHPVTRPSCAFLTTNQVTFHIPEAGWTESKVQLHKS